MGKLVVSFSNPVKASDPNRGPGSGNGVNRPMQVQAGRTGGAGIVAGGSRGTTAGGMMAVRGMMASGSAFCSAART